MEACIGHSATLTSKASILFNTSYSIGCILAPILGGLMNQKLGFQTTCDALAISSLVIAAVYFLGSLLPACLSEKKNLIELEKQS